MMILEDKGIAVEEYIVAREKHEDGEPHLHCYLKLAKRFETMKQDLLDLYDEDEGISYHGNY